MVKKYQMTVTIESSYRSKDHPEAMTDDFVCGHIDVDRARLLFDLCTAHFGWACSFDEMHPDKHGGVFKVFAGEIGEACQLATELPPLIAKANAAETYDCLFTIGFSIQGCEKPDGEGLDGDDFGRAIARRVRDISSHGEWLEAVQCIESVPEQTLTNAQHPGPQ